MKVTFVSTASSPVDDTDSRCVEGWPSGCGVSVFARLMYSAGTLPACAALKTRLSPSGMKRALEMNIGSKVLICEEMLAPTAGLPIPRLPATNPAGAPINNAAAAIAGHSHPRDGCFLSETASVFAVDVPES